MAADVNETPQAEAILKALEASEERFRFLAETIPVQVWTALSDGNIEYVTNQTAEHLGMSVEQLLAEGWQNAVHADDLPLSVERWEHSLRTGEAYEVEFRLKLANGDYAFHLSRAIPHRDAKGAIVRWFGTNTNIAEQREQRRQRDALVLEVSKQLLESEAAYKELQEKCERLTARIKKLEASSGGLRE